ncbi:hypothetical protein I6F15_22910 [Bradyrhizobium sp. BRP14]|nr:hypothetical protein [Bradyrhizobium sp. BRP14]
MAEYLAAEAMGLELARPRTPGYDAIRLVGDQQIRIQIKGRVFGEESWPDQRLGTIKQGADCDTVMLVLLDNTSLALREICEAPTLRLQLGLPCVDL